MVLSEDTCKVVKCVKPVCSCLGVLYGHIEFKTLFFQQLHRTDHRLQEQIDHLMSVPLIHSNVNLQKSVPTCILAVTNGLTALFGLKD